MVTNAAGAAVDYFSALPSGSGTPPPGYTALTGVHMMLPPQSNNTFEVTNNRIDTSTRNDSIALLNPNLTPVNVFLVGLAEAGIVFQQTIVVPPGTLYLIQADNLVAGALPGGGLQNAEMNLWILASAPMEMAEYIATSQNPALPEAVSVIPAGPGPAQYQPQSLSIASTLYPISWKLADWNHATGGVHRILRKSQRDLYH